MLCFASAQDRTDPRQIKGYFNANGAGHPAFVNLHSAAGIGHALSNVFTVFRNRTPLVITAGQQARSLLPHALYLFAERPTDFPQPYVK